MGIRAESSSHQSPVPNIEHTCRCQAVISVTEPFSPQFPFLQRVRSMKSVSFAMLRAEEAGVFQTHETLCQEDSRLLVLQCDCFHKSSHYQGSRCLIRFGARLSRALNNSSHAGSINTCPNSMSCHSCQLMRHSFSNPIHSKSPVPNREHTFMSSSSDHCHCERTILSTVSILAKVRSMKSVSFAMCNVASWKAGVFPDTWNPVKKILDSWLLMPLRERLPPSQLMAIKAVDLDMSRFLPSSYPMRQQLAKRCNDTVVSRLPGQMSPTVAMTKFLSDWCEGLVHPSSFAKELPVLFATTERLNIFPNWKFITLIQQICWTLYRIQGFSMVFSCRCQPVTTGSLWDCETTTGSVCFAMLMTEESWAQQTPQVADVGKKLSCWCCVTTAMQSFRFAARMSKAWCEANIHNRVSDLC